MTHLLSLTFNYSSCFRNKVEHFLFVKDAIVSIKEIKKAEDAR